MSRTVEPYCDIPPRIPGHRLGDILKRVPDDAGRIALIASMGGGVREIPEDGEGKIGYQASDLGIADTADPDGVFLATGPTHSTTQDSNCVATWSNGTPADLGEYYDEAGPGGAGVGATASPGNTLAPNIHYMCEGGASFTEQQTLLNLDRNTFPDVSSNGALPGWWGVWESSGDYNWAHPGKWGDRLIDICNSCENYGKCNTFDSRVLEAIAAADAASGFTPPPTGPGGGGSVTTGTAGELCSGGNDGAGVEYALPDGTMTLVPCAAGLQCINTSTLTKASDNTMGEVIKCGVPLPTERRCTDAGECGLFVEEAPATSEDIEWNLICGGEDGSQAHMDSTYCALDDTCYHNHHDDGNYGVDYCRVYSESGAPRMVCSETDGTRGRCVTAPPDTDCSGTWSCNLSCEKVLSITTPQSGDGLACPTADRLPPCNEGQDLCPQDIDCVGHWPDCTSACEGSGERIWRVDTVASGQGNCPQASQLSPACQPSDGLCEPDVDCAGEWSPCDPACNRRWTRTVRPSGDGDPCPSTADQTEQCQSGDGYCPWPNCPQPTPVVGGTLGTCDDSAGIPPGGSCVLGCRQDYFNEYGDLTVHCNTRGETDPWQATCAESTDCSGTWSDCTRACEAAGARTWTENIAQSGTGTACPAADDCQPGEDACPSNVDCAGLWSTCTSACEAAGARHWTESAAQSGTGTACPAADDCQPGEDACPSNVDCAGLWSTCTSTCERVWTESAAQSGTGTACPQASACQPGDDACPPTDCSGTWSDCDIDCERTYTIIEAASPGGTPCGFLDGQRRPDDCYPGLNACPHLAAAPRCDEILPQPREGGGEGGLEWTTCPDGTRFGSSGGGGYPTFYTVGTTDITSIAMECCNPPDRATENRQDEIPDAATTCADLITDTGFKCNSMIPGADYGNEWGMDAEGDPYIITGYCNKLCGISDSTPPPDEPYPPNPPNPYPVDTRVWYEEERRRDQHTWDPTITCRRPSATSPTGFESSGQDDCRIKWRWQLSTQTQADCDAVIGQRGGGCVYTDASADAVGDSQGH